MNLLKNSVPKRELGEAQEGGPSGNQFQLEVITGRGCVLPPSRANPELSVFPRAAGAIRKKSLVTRREGGVQH